MDIKGLTLDEVGERIKAYLPPFLQDNFQFQESYQLEFSEVNHNIPKKYHKHFKDNDLINCTSGSVEVGDCEHDFVVSLVSNADYSKALFLFLQKVDKQTGEEETTMLKSFLNGESNLTIEQLERYKKYLTDVQNFIDDNIDKLQTDKIGKKFKKKLLDLIVQTTKILEEYY
jgi:hypothetical protein